MREENRGVPPRPESLPAAARPRIPIWLALAGAVTIGVLTAAQARVNGQLGLRLEDAFLAAFISFGSGLVILSIACAVFPSGRRGFGLLVRGLREGRIPWWMLAGGAAGAFTVATQGLVVATIGVSLFTVGVVAGQTVSGLLIDRVGFGPGGAVAVTIPRVAGGALALIAVVLSFGGAGVGAIPLWMLVLPFLAGAGIAWQQGTNGRLRQRVGSPLTATLVNFIGGTLLLGIVALVHTLVEGPPSALPTEWWVYLGGAMGVTYVFLGAAIVAYTGVLLLGLASVVGQLLTAVVLDWIWPAYAGSGDVRALVVVTIALASVVVAAVPWRRRRRGGTRPGGSG